LRTLLDSVYERPIPSSSDYLNTPLFIAVERNDIPMIKYLIQRSLRSSTSSLTTSSDQLTGKNTDDFFDLEINFVVPSRMFRTALHVACMNGNEEVIEILLDKKANPTIKDFTGKIAYELCKDKEVKLFMRKYAGKHPLMWEWSQAAQIVPLTEEMELEEKKKKVEKK